MRALVYDRALDPWETTRGLRMLSVPLVRLDEQKLRGAGLFKEERVISTPQSVLIQTGGREVLNFCRPLRSASWRRI